MHRPVALGLLLSCLAIPASACGPDTDCAVGDRTYRVYLPETEGPMGAIVYAHGYRGSAEAAMRNPAFEALADELDMAFVALDAGGPDWDLAHTPSNPDREEAREFGYVAAVLDDLGDRIDLDPQRIVATGFSAGGMMTWTLACGDADVATRFAGFIPLSGTFWAPVPETCDAAPSNLVHIHGTEDPTVPLGGRAIGPTRQGDVVEALAMYRVHGGYAGAEAAAGPDGMTCTRETAEDGHLLEFCTFEGGHSFSAERLRYGIEQVLGAD